MLLIKSMAPKGQCAHDSRWSCPLAVVFVEQKVQTVRCSYQALCLNPLSEFLTQVQQEAKISRKIYLQARLKTTEAFLGLDSMGYQMTRSHLQECVERLRVKGIKTLEFFQENKVELTNFQDCLVSKNP